MVAGSLKALLFAFLLISPSSACIKFGHTGYIIYCPCMGRFGNKAESFLGALSFARALGRTLVLPPWPTMKGYINFEDWFELEQLEIYHKVISMHIFMSDIAPDLWPPGERYGFCVTPNNNMDAVCDLKQGSPFGPFWDHHGIDFDDNFNHNLSYYNYLADEWNERFPADVYPVLAFRGAPGSFPAIKDNLYLEQYLIWTDEMVEKAVDHVTYSVGTMKYMAIHLRNGNDWEKACSHAAHKMKSFMSSYQCEHLRPDLNSPLNWKICLPQIEDIIDTCRSALLKHSDVKIVYILTDKNPYLHELQTALNDLHVQVVFSEPDIPQIDAIIASRAEVFIGNCVSSFTSFIVRQRKYVYDKSSYFWGTPVPSTSNKPTNTP